VVGCESLDKYEWLGLWVFLASKLWARLLPKAVQSRFFNGDCLINASAQSVGDALSTSAHAGSLSSGPLRIALLGYRSAPFSGGQGVYLKYLSRALVKQGHTVTVISGPPYPDLDVDVQLQKLPSLDLYAHGLKSVSIGQLFKDPLARAEWLSKLTGGFIEPWTFGERARDWLLAHADEFDVVHDNQTLSDGILDIQQAGIPLVTTIHHPITRDRKLALAAEPRWTRRLMIRRWHDFLTMQTAVARQLNYIVTVSKVSRTDIIADFGVDPATIAVMYNGVEADLFRPMAHIERQPAQIIATASADTPHKGLQVLLRAAASLRQEGRELNLVLIGKPRAGGATEQLVSQLNLNAHIRWVSGVEHATIVELYAESTVAVVPSLYEGFGLPAVEAMACGIPLIVSDGGALPEVAGEGGVVVPAGDPDALAAAIKALLDDPAARAALGARARERGINEFSWDVCAARLVHYYRGAIAGLSGDDFLQPAETLPVQGDVLAC
jgi:glycosyltransferase involved in cell wall biosynthesis